MSDNKGPDQELRAALGEALVLAGLLVAGFGAALSDTLTRSRRASTG
jgi:hypothetical protein